MEDFDIAPSKIGESGQRVVDRAIEECRRRGHAVVTNEHVFLALVQVEWDAFAQVTGELAVNPHELLAGLEHHLNALPEASDTPLTVAPATKLVFKLAFHEASRAGRSRIEAIDLFAAVFEESQGAPASAVRRRGVEPEVFVARMTTRMRDHAQQEARLQQRFELPAQLRSVATNLSLLARQDRIAPVYGRDDEIRQVLEILCHRERSNSVMLIGEPGVGKTAIVEGLARRIELEPDTVPPRLRDCQIVNLQMNDMVAGTMLRGMFEDRVQAVIREIRQRPNLILFVDEAHTMVGAGAALGAPADAANVFKSALARGEVRIIGATTLSEYKQYIQEDEALSRRFRTVYVPEPTLEETRRILCGVRERLERNYSVRVSNDALETALEMAPRYQRHLHLPDKVIGWLDTAAVRAEIDRRSEVLGHDVVEVISSAADIPRDMVFRDVEDRFRDIDERLSTRVIGQRRAVEAVVQRLVLSKGPLKDGFDRPDGVLLFLGPTGVGKTELAKATAQFLFGDERKLIRIDMSEYQDGGVSVDKLIGMPRGVVGSQRGGVLTNQLRDTPCSVVLLDEIEKASPSLLNVFLQAFDEGWISDGRGRRVYLSDAIVIMTSNAGSEHFRRLQSPLGFRSGQATMDQVQGEITRELERRFSPEFLNRIDQVVIFEPLTRDEVGRIAEKHLGELVAVMRRSGKALIIEPEAHEALVDEGYSLVYGARFLKRVIDDRIKLPLSRQWKDAHVFRAAVTDGQIVVETVGPRLRASSDPGAIAV